MSKMNSVNCRRKETDKTGRYNGTDQDIQESGTKQTCALNGYYIIS